MLLCSLISIFLTPIFDTAIAQIQKFAVIGDFGTNDKCNTNESAVAGLVNGWNPAFIITVGDNIYYGRNNVSQNSCTHEHVNDYDSTIEKYYGNYFTRNVSTNRFYPSIGDHEIAGEIDTDPRPGFYLAYYKEYFALPNNERYYTFLKGNIRFICINNDFGGKSTWTGGGYSDTTVWEPDGIDSSSVQGMWVKSILDTSRAKWHVIYQHKPVYFSFVSNALDKYKRVRWPFKRWGADIVLNGDLHWYERVRKGNMTYITNGLGGGKFDPLFDDTLSNFVRIPESKILYNNQYGAQLVEEYKDSLVFKFVTINNQVIDRYILLQPRTIRVRTLFEGAYNRSNGKMIPDTVRVYLRRKNSPYTIFDSAKAVTDSLGFGLYNFTKAIYDSSYYISIHHRNSIETWSKNPVVFDDELQYDFTVDSAKAYGNNLIKKGDKWCIFSGDVLKDGAIDATDLSISNNDASNYLTGYLQSDMNGDRITDASDVIVVGNNVYRYVLSVKPSSYPGGMMISP